MESENKIIYIKLGLLQIVSVFGLCRFGNYAVAQMVGSYVSDSLTFWRRN